MLLTEEKLSLGTSFISFINVDEFVSISSSVLILVKICSAILKEAYSAGTYDPIKYKVKVNCDVFIKRKYY